VIVVGWVQTTGHAVTQSLVASGVMGSAPHEAFHPVLRAEYLEP
jgi:hypothetical protein